MCGSRIILSLCETARRPLRWRQRERRKRRFLRVGLDYAHFELLNEALPNVAEQSERALR